MSIKSPLSRQFGSRFDSVFDVVKSNPVYDKVSRIPTLDLDFAKTKSLYDGRSTKNLIDFVRDTASNSSTYVGADRLIKRSVTNLLTYSEQFDEWIKTNATVTVDSSIELAPDGTATADKIVETDVTDFHYVDNPTPNPTVTNGQAFTASFYVKAGERTTIHAYLISSGILTGTPTQFDLSTGEIVSGSQATMQDVGNGWYRCSITGTANSTIGKMRILLNGNIPYDGDGTSGIYLWGAQLEEASTAGEYVKTTTTRSGAPRFDHDPATGESLGLLVEESRENLVLYSEGFDDASWVKSQSSISDNTEIAPTGSMTADSLIENTSPASQHYTTQSITITANTLYTATVYVKANTRFSIRFGFLNSALSNGAFAHFNASTGVISTETTAGDASSVSYGMTDVGSGWYRCRVSCIVDSSSTTGRIFIGLVDGSNNANYTGDGTSGIYIWGAQLEAGAFPTSYIPTEGAAVTRGADAASISGTNFSSWYEQSEGTVFAGFELLQGGSASGSTDNPGVFGFIDSSGTGFRGRGSRLDLNSSASIRFASRIGSNTQEVTFYSEYLQPSQPYLAAYAYADNLLTGSANGNSVNSTTDSNYSSLPAPDTLLIGDQEIGGTPTVINGTIKRITYWDERVANEKLQSVTS
jgi:hypothetical protein